MAKGEVRLKGIYKRFGDFEALKRIDLEIKPVEFFALLGPSGSGKTTTLRMIAGLETPDEGVIEVDGEDVTFAAPGARDIAMVFQNYALYPHMTVYDNIAFPLKMDKTPTAEIRPQVRQAAERVDIHELLDRRPGQLSGGQQQRCALSHRSRFLRAAVEPGRPAPVADPCRAQKAAALAECNRHLRDP